MSISSIFVTIISMPAFIKPKTIFPASLEQSHPFPVSLWQFLNYLLLSRIGTKRIWPTTRRKLSSLAWIFPRRKLQHPRSKLHWERSSRWWFRSRWRNVRILWDRSQIIDQELISALFLLLLKQNNYESKLIKWCVRWDLPYLHWSSILSCDSSATIPYGLFLMLWRLTSVVITNPSRSGWRSYFVDRR